MFPLSLSIPLQNGPLFAIILICSCCSLRRNTMLVFFNNCCLTNVSLIQFEINHIEQVARCLNQWKNTNGLINNRLTTLPCAAFLCLRQQMVSLIFQTAITGGWHSGMPGYFCLLWVSGGTKRFWLFLLLRIHKRQIMSKGKWRHLDKMNVAKSL